MFELDFAISPWWILPGILVAGAASWWLYNRMGEALPPAVKWGLTLLRFFALLILFFLLLEPLLNSLSRTRTLPVVAVLQDDTESLLVQRDSAFVKNELPGLLTRFLSAFDKNEYTSVLHPFSASLGNPASPDSLSFNDAGTNISGSLEELRKQYANQNLGAVVLVTDGISTSGANPLYVAESFRKPVFTVLVGDTSVQKDISIPTVLVNEIAYLGTETPMQARIHSNGYESESLRVTLEHKGKILGQQDITLTRGQPDKDVLFTVRTDEVGIQQFNLSVTELKDEITWRNNKAIVYLNVMETKVKIALFAGGPHPDIGAIREPLLNDKRFELTEFIHRDRSTFYNSPDRYNLRDFDLVILHNFPFGKDDAAMVTKITAAMKENNLPVMLFAGIFTDLRTAAPLLELTGLYPAMISDNQEEVQARFRTEYDEHSTFTFDRDWITLMNQAPPLMRNKSDWRARPETKVYATTVIRNVQLDYPLYALQHSLSRKNMVFLGENFWRMRSHVYVEKKSFRAFDEWIINNIQWLVVKEDKRRFKVFPSKRLYSGNEPVLFRGEVYDENFNAVKGAEVRLNVKTPQNTDLVYYLNETGASQYFAELPNLAEGTYSYYAEGKKGGLKLGDDRGQFSIGKSNIEHLNLRADAGLLQQMALRTGGKFIVARDLASLPDEIRKIESLKPVVDFKKTRKGFHELTWIFLILIGMLTVEWVVRKVYSLV